MITTSKTHAPFICPVAVATQGPAALCAVPPRNALHLLRSAAPNHLPHSCLRPEHRAMPATPRLRAAGARLRAPVAQPLENPAHA
ncbi:hypothetical protein D3C85_1278780 [compost metagenome]